MIQAAHSVMRCKARKAGTHALYGRGEIARVEIGHGNSQVIAMMEFVLG